MTAQELQDEAADAVARTARFELLTNQAETTGLVFDYNTPLPKQPTYRPREWETRIEYFGRLQVHQPVTQPKPRKTP